MKEKSIFLPPSPVYNKKNQCDGKKPYDLKRRALKDARGLSKDTGRMFTVYECPHCHKFHVGGVRSE